MSGNNQLQTIIERIEKLEEEKAAIAADIKDVFAEAKSSGFDPKIIKKVIALRKQDSAKRREEQELLAVYMDALGMLSDTPLGRAAVEREFADTPLGRAAVEREFAGAAAEAPEDF